MGGVPIIGVVVPKWGGSPMGSRCVAGAAVAPQLGVVLGALLGVLERGRPHEMELALSALHELGESPQRPQNAPNDPKGTQKRTKTTPNGPK